MKSAILVLTVLAGTAVGMPVQSLYSQNLPPFPMDGSIEGDGGGMDVTPASRPKSTRIRKASALLTDPDYILSADTPGVKRAALGEASGRPTMMSQRQTAAGLAGAGALEGADAAQGGNEDPTQEEDVLVTRKQLAGRVSDPEIWTNGIKNDAEPADPATPKDKLTDITNSHSGHPRPGSAESVGSRRAATEGLSDAHYKAALTRTLADFNPQDCLKRTTTVEDEDFVAFCAHLMDDGGFGSPTTSMKNAFDWHDSGISAGGN